MGACSATEGGLHRPDGLADAHARRGKRPRRWRPLRSAPDEFSIVMPASWKVPGAQAAPTMPNKERSDGSLRATAATVGEIATGGAELRSPRFGVIAPDDASAVTIGGYASGPMSTSARSVRRSARRCPTIWS
jgi:hypothetical protein